MTPGHHHPGTCSTALETLAAELLGEDYEARLVTHPGRRPFVRVRNHRAGVLTENIYAGDGLYWWGWAQRIAPVADPAGAAREIAGVLRDLSQAGHHG